MSSKLNDGLRKMEDWMVMKHRDHKTRRCYHREVQRFAEWLSSNSALHQLSSERKIEAYLTMRARQGCAAITPGVALTDVQKAMGHRQISTTAGYCTAEIDRLPSPPALVR